MRIDEITRMIASAFEDEKRSVRLGSSIRTIAQRNGAQLSEQEVEKIVAFVKLYIQLVPQYLSQGIGAAQQAGLSQEIAQMGSALEAYWFQREDLIPDHLGLLGVMDDAYASLFLLQSLSDYCKQTIGQPLIPIDLTSSNQFIRKLIGEPAATTLDQQVIATITQSLVEQMASRIAMNGLFMGAGAPGFAPSEQYEIDQRVNTQLGMMGIF